MTEVRTDFVPNEMILKIFIKKALELKSKGKKHGAKKIMESLRGEIPYRQSSEFQINNTDTADYARLAMAKNRRLRGYFKIKTRTLA